jgi:hypothetical protein
VKTSSTQRAVRYYHPKEQANISMPAQFSHMLQEDLHLGIMPIGGRSTRPNFKVSLIPASPGIELMLCEGLSRSDSTRTLAEALWKFFDEASHVLAIYGRAYYEIVYYSKNDSSITGFELNHISNNNIHDTLGFRWQFIPRRQLWEEAHPKRPKFIYLPNRCLMTLKWPTALGGIRRHGQLLRDLSLLSKDIMPEFAMEEMKAGTKTRVFDYTQYNHSRDVYLAKSTRQLGWHARGLLNDKTLEYFRIFRHLRFAHTTAVLREYILKELGNALSRIGNILGTKIQITVAGLPSSKDCETYMQELREAKLQFSDIWGKLHD